MRHLLFLFLCSFIFSACLPESPNLNPQGEDVLTAQQVYTKKSSLPYLDTAYVPIYSDIYTKNFSEKILLTATLSIRNTSLLDSIFISDINYYNSAGDLVRSYLSEGTIYLKPMQTIEYIIEQKDKTGGSGANFVINWGSKKLVHPMFQGVMISTSGKHGLSFTTEGVSIKR